MNHDKKIQRIAKIKQPFARIQKFDNSLSNKEKIRFVKLYPILAKEMFCNQNNEIENVLILEDTAEKIKAFFALSPQQQIGFLYTYPNEVQAIADEVENNSELQEFSELMLKKKALVKPKTDCSRIMKNSRTNTVLKIKQK